MTAISRWPALAGSLEWLGGRLVTRRGIWGKVPGASSDFRWIARSRGFAEGRDDLAQALRIGAENQPVRAALWRRLPDRHLAANVYPSRARDSAGRPALIEKQVVEWRSPGPVPACAAALLLLPQVAGYGDTDWWGHHDGEPWHLPRHSLEIPETGCPAPRLDPEVIEAAIGAGLDAIRSHVPAAALVAFYVNLLSGEPFPAHLAVKDPLPAEAIAALLLPLPRDWAEQVSIAGGVAERRFQRVDMRERWDAVATPYPPDDPTPAPEPEIEDLAQAVGEALASGDPSRLVAIYHRRETGDASSAPQVSAPVEPGSDQASLQDLVVEVQPPPADSPRVIRLLHAFARTSDQRLLDLDAIARALAADGIPALAGESERLLCTWPAALEEARPRSADRRQWAIKCDQLRAAAWCLFPAPRRIDDPGLPGDPAVPALLLAVLCADSRVDAALADLGRDAFAAALGQGLSCPHPALARRVATWAEAWCRASGAPPWAAEIAAMAQPRV